MHWRGFFEMTPGRSTVVYMDEIAVDGYTMKEIALLKKHVYTKMEDGLKKYRKYKTGDIQKNIVAENLNG